MTTIGELNDQTFLKDHVYIKIGEWYLYDNTKLPEYLILHNRRQRKEPIVTKDENGKESIDFIDVEGEFNNNLNNWIFDNVSKSIYQANYLGSPLSKEETVVMMDRAVKTEGLTMVKLLTPLKYIKMLHNPQFGTNYHAYSVWFDVTAHDNINLYDFDLATEWISGNSSFGTTNRLYDFNVNSKHYGK